jgi:hypothetical protein
LDIEDILNKSLPAKEVPAIPAPESSNPAEPAPMSEEWKMKHFAFPEGATEEEKKELLRKFEDFAEKNKKGIQEMLEGLKEAQSTMEKIESIKGRKIADLEFDYEGRLKKLVLVGTDLMTSDLEFSTPSQILLDGEKLIKEQEVRNVGKANVDNGLLGEEKVPKTPEPVPETEPKKD